MLFGTDIPIDDLRQPPARGKSLSMLSALLVVTFAASAVGIFSPPDDWYAGLAKPSWNPPNWVFGPVWSTLYLLMAIAAWLVWRRWGTRYGRLPLALYLAQLSCNAIWSPLFFGLHQIGWALVDLAVLWILVAATTAAFWERHRLAGMLMMPYLAWISFAGVLNYQLWRLNP